MSPSAESQVRQIIADVLNLSAAELTHETSPQSVDNWDSVQHLNIVLALEQQLGIQFDPEEIEKMQTVGAITRLFAQKQAERP
jgi:acyl carrier protein